MLLSRTIHASLTSMGLRIPHRMEGILNYEISKATTLMFLRKKNKRRWGKWRKSKWLKKHVGKNSDSFPSLTVLHLQASLSGFQWTSLCLPETLLQPNSLPPPIPHLECSTCLESLFGSWRFFNNADWNRDKLSYKSKAYTIDKPSPHPTPIPMVKLVLHIDRNFPYIYI